SGELHSTTNSVEATEKLLVTPIERNDNSLAPNRLSNTCDARRAISRTNNAWREILALPTSFVLFHHLSRMSTTCPTSSLLPLYSHLFFPCRGSMWLRYTTMQRRPRGSVKAQEA